eukprot:759718-Hanusia_phi.AAC.1
MGSPRAILSDVWGDFDSEILGRRGLRGWGSDWSREGKQRGWGGGLIGVCLGTRALSVTIRRVGYSQPMM